MHVFLQVKNVAILFKIMEQSVYLVDEVDNFVIFPSENGKFSRDRLKEGGGYEVHGTDTSSATTPVPPIQPYGSSTTTPYGSYPRSTFPTTCMPPHPPTQKANKIKKGILLVTISKKDKPKGKVDYTAVTQVILSLSSSQCNVPAAANLVSEQVGFEVILLDSKCYPLLPNEGTSGTEFWKGTRKILAASKAIYEKLTGLSGDMNIKEINLTSADNEPGPSTKPEEDEPGPTKKQRLEPGVMENVIGKLISQLEFVDVLARQFHCAICQGIPVKPQVSRCCQRVIGCESCVDRWLNTKLTATCPLCGTVSDIRFTLKGFDDILKFASLQRPEDANSGADHSASLRHHDDSSDSDFV